MKLSRLTNRQLRNLLRRGEVQFGRYDSDKLKDIYDKFRRFHTMWLGDLRDGMFRSEWCKKFEDLLFKKQIERESPETFEMYYQFYKLVIAQMSKLETLFRDSGLEMLRKAKKDYEEIARKESK